MDIGIPPSSHFIYIPTILILGLVLGFIMGARSTREAIRIDQERALARARRKAERAEKSGKDATSLATADKPAGPTGSSP